MTGAASSEPVRTVTGQKRKCPNCGLVVPKGLNKCPNDGTAVNPDGLMPSELSHKYEFESLLGEGGMSIVYKAKHLLMKKTVAIKLLRSSLQGDDMSLKRFQREAETASRLKHPNIIEVYDFGILEHGEAYLVMDYLEGESLAEILKEKGPLPIADMLEVCLVVCSGLSHAHANQILHRDLKPSNLMICKEIDGARQIKLVDFGIAKLIGDAQHLTSTGEVFGSPLYMSPEQCMGKELDARSDIYSMGCLICEVLSGKPPLKGGTAFETVYKHVNEEAPPLELPGVAPDVVQMVQSIIDRALKKDPEERYQSIDELLDDLKVLQEKVAGRKTTTKLHASRSHKKAGSLLSNKAMVTLAGIALVLIGSGFLLINVFHKPDSDSTFNKLKHIHGKLKTWQPTGNPGMVTDDDVQREIVPGGYGKVILGSTEITDKACVMLAQLPTLIELDIEDTDITDAGLQALAASKTLATINLRDVKKVTDDGVIALTKLPRLSGLYLGHTRVSDKALEAIGNCPKIDRLGFVKDKITDDGMKYLCNLPNLIGIDLSETEVTAEGLKHLPVDKLMVLNLQGTQIGGKDLTVISRFHNLRELNLSGCTIGDANFSEIFKLTKLAKLNIQQCPVTHYPIAEMKRRLPQCHVEWTDPD